MTETWLRANRRILCLGLLPASLLGGLGLITYLLVEIAWIDYLAIATMTLSCLLFFGLIHQLLRPRIAYRDGQVLFFLKSSGPIGVPIELVEAFFFGQGLADLPDWLAKSQETETVNLVARLSRRAPQWSKMQVKPALGRWEDGYVVLRGTWCEPLSDEMIRQLNHRLNKATTAWKESLKNKVENQT